MSLYAFVCPPASQMRGSKQAEIVNATTANSGNGVKEQKQKSVLLYGVVSVRFRPILNLKSERGGYVNYL